MFTTDRLVVGLLIAIGLSAGALLALAWWLGPAPNTLGYELAKALLQLLVVTVVGTAASLAAFNYQRYRDRRREIQDRSDQLLRALLDDALHNYHQVKRARRILRARLRMPGAHNTFDLSVYDEQLAAINDAQLEFERLIAMSHHLGDPRIDSPKLQESLRAIEMYLGKLVTEYERKRAAITSDQSEASGRFDELNGFIGTGKQPFKEVVPVELHKAVDQLQSALLRPLDPASKAVTRIG